MSWDEIVAVAVVVVALFGALYLWSRIRPPGVPDDPEFSRRAVFRRERERWRRRHDPPEDSEPSD